MAQAATAKRLEQQEPGRATRVLVVDDRPEICRFMATMLDLEGVDVVAIAYDGADALTKTIDLQPDVVVMDLRMPSINGATATRLIKERFPRIRVLGLTGAEPERAWELSAAGADRVFQKIEFNALAAEIRAMPRPA